MRRMLVSRSSRLKPRPFDRCVRTTSPSSSSTLAPAERRRSTTRSDTVLFPAPDIPVNQSVKPLCMGRFYDLLDQNVECALDAAVGCEVDAALLVAVLL